MANLLDKTPTLTLDGLEWLYVAKGLTDRRVQVNVLANYIKSGITKSDVGLGNVDNTSDANKPISSLTQAALDGKVAYTDILAGSNVTVSYNNITKKITISSTGGSGSPESQNDFNDNGSVQLVVGSTATDRAVMLDYTLQSFDQYGVGSIQVIHDDNGNVGMRHEFTNIPPNAANKLTDVTFTPSVVGADIVLTLSAVNVGSNLKLKVKNRNSITKAI